MLPAERHKGIVQLINTKGSVRVKELSRIFEVTEETVRRDLDSLEAEGKVLRSHGGAIRVEENHAEIPYVLRESENVEEKQAIAREAVRFIEPGDRIVLDASTTAWHVSLLLPNISVTVVTNSLKVSMELAGRHNIEVITTGGIVRANSLSLVGPLAEEALEQFYVDKAFLSCKGLHSEHGISESNALQALVKRKMIDISRKVYLLVDHSKIQMRDFTRVASVDEIDVVITDKQAPSDDVAQIEQYGVEVIMV